MNAESVSYLRKDQYIAENRVAAFWEIVGRSTSQDRAELHNLNARSQLLFIELYRPYVSKIKSPETKQAIAMLFCKLILEAQNRSEQKLKPLLLVDALQLDRYLDTLNQHGVSEQELDALLEAVNKEFFV